MYIMLLTGIKLDILFKDALIWAYESAAIHKSGGGTCDINGSTFSNALLDEGLGLRIRSTSSQLILGGAGLDGQIR